MKLWKTEYLTNCSITQFFYIYFAFKCLLNFLFKKTRPWMLVYLYYLPLDNISTSHFYYCNIVNAIENYDINGEK